MGVTHDLTAWLTGRAVPRYGREVPAEGRELPSPERIRVPTRHGPVRCLRYGGRRDGRYVHVHGGAFVVRHPQMDDFWARHVVATTGLEVLLPDYHVAPRVRFPVAHDEMLDIVAHLAADGVPTTVGGFSGGGNLAASVALRARDEGVPVRGQLLAVPSLDVAEDIDSKRRSAPNGMIDRRLLTLVRETYFRDADRRADPTASPLLAPDLAGLPSTMIVTAEHDTLRREGDRYAQRLRDAGVPTEHVVAPGVDHYFLHGAGDAQARDLLARMAAWLGRVTHG